jgi:hypothetical protein
MQPALSDWCAENEGRETSRLHRERGGAHVWAHSGPRRRQRVGAGAMLVACRLAGLSALEAHYPGRPSLTSSSTTSASTCHWRRVGPRGLGRPHDRRLKGAKTTSGRTCRSSVPPYLAGNGGPARPAPGAPPGNRSLEQRQALHQRQELAPGKAGRYRGGNCPGCGSAPIEACCKADGVHTIIPLLRFVLDGPLGCFPSR